MVDGRIMDKCKACGADMKWAVTFNGTKVPLSVKSRELRFVLMGETFQQRETWLNHFIDCPDRDQFRKKHKEVQEKLL